MLEASKKQVHLKSYSLKIRIDSVNQILDLAIFLSFFFWAVREVKGQKVAQNDKTFCLSHFISHSHLIIYGTLVWNNDICRHFFRLFKVLIFWVVRGLKGQKMVQNEKKICLSCSISQETCIIWFSFMVHLCKMVISTGTFFIFSEFWFSGLGV